MPVHLSQDLVLSPPAGAQPLTHARIGIDTIATLDNFLAAASTAGAADWPATAVCNPLTYEAWSPADDTAGLVGELRWRNLDLLPVDFVGLAGHNLGSSGTRVRVEYGSDLTSWTTVLDTTPSNDDPIMALFTEVVSVGWRVRIGPYTSTPPQLSVVYLGEALQLPRPIYGGHAPVPLARRTVVHPVVSETGQWLGRTIQRKGVAGGYSWRHIEPAWVRATWDPSFVQLARSRPFFVAWRPSDYPAEVVYAWTQDDPRASNMGVGRFMEISLDVEGLDVS